MELSEVCPDVSDWRHDRHEAFELGGAVVPGLFRDVYRYREDSTDEDSLSCAFYTLHDKRVLSVWGVVGGADCCRYHQLEEGAVLPGAPNMRVDVSEHSLWINDKQFAL